MRWIGGTLDTEMTKEIAALDTELQILSEKNRFINE